MKPDLQTFTIVFLCFLLQKSLRPKCTFHSLFVLFFLASKDMSRSNYLTGLSRAQLSLKGDGTISSSCIHRFLAPILKVTILKFSLPIFPLLFRLIICQSVLLLDNVPCNIYVDSLTEQGTKEIDSLKDE